METSAGSEQSLLALELTRGQDLLRQLESHLDQPSENHLCRSLASNILASIEKALCIARSNNIGGDRQPACPHSGTDSGDSPTSKSSGRAFRDGGRKDKSKKRKTQLPKCANQVRVSSGEGVEGPLDDGYSWRKYGQKVILGAKYPRGYHRCSHRHSQGCPAIKQVQRSDNNPSVFDVTYLGSHTCLQSQEQKHHQLHPQDQTKQQQQLLMSFRTGLRVKTEGLGEEGQHLDCLSFSFPSTPISCLNPENQVFTSHSTLDDCFMGGFSSPFISPTISESNYFSVSPRRMSSYGERVDLQAMESDFTEIISAANSATNSPMVDLDFTLDPVELELDFPFDVASFFS